MKTKKSGAKYSAIVGIGEELKKLERETGQEYLALNRGINNVVKIDLNEIASEIDYNTAAMQFYAPTTGSLSLKKAINSEYFDNKADTDNIMITGGGMNALNILFSTLDVEKIYSHSMFWGAYANILKITKIEQDFYSDYEELAKNPEKFKNSAIIICDPNNPVGNKYSDKRLLEIVETLEKHDVTVIWDGPYRRLFYGNTDNLYQKLLQFKNVIITESFSKSVGLSGQRLGFIHTQNEELNKEVGIKLLYCNNGINTFSQILIEKLLTTKKGKKASSDFKKETVKHISRNIQYLIDNKLLASEFYQKSTPVGIFVIVNKSYEELLDKNIGSVPLNYFTKRTDIKPKKFSRICVSVPNDKFVSFFDKFKVIDNFSN